MILAGDEFGRSQKGNNNSWCQDNETSWLDWSLIDKNSGFHRFFKKCIHLRKQYSIFRRDKFFLPPGPAHPDGGSEITWQYLAPGSQNWSHDCHGLAFHLHSSQDNAHYCDFFLMVNTHREKTLYFTTPEPDNNDCDWQLVIDTAADSPDDFPPTPGSAVRQKDKTIGVPPFGCTVLRSSMIPREK